MADRSFGKGRIPINEVKSLGTPEIPEIPERRSLRRTVTRSLTPCRTAFSPAFSTAAGLMARAQTREHPFNATVTAVTPAPQPTSRKESASSYGSQEVNSRVAIAFPGHTSGSRDHSRSNAVKLTPGDRSRYRARSHNPTS